MLCSSLRHSAFSHWHHTLKQTHKHPWIKKRYNGFCLTPKWKPFSKQLPGTTAQKHKTEEKWKSVLCFLVLHYTKMQTITLAYTLWLMGESDAVEGLYCWWQGAVKEGQASCLWSCCRGDSGPQTNRLSPILWSLRGKPKRILKLPRFFHMK